MERLFNLDAQLIHDTVLTMIAVFVMFTFLSYLLFNPVKNMLKKREERIKDNIDSAAKDKADAAALKADYEAKLKEIQKEADQILADARKKALDNEARIVEEAKAEAARIIDRANRQVELERKKAADEMKQEMIQVASLMAAKVVGAQMNTQIQDSLLEDTLKEIGDQTWLS